MIVRVSVVVQLNIALKRLFMYLMYGHVPNISSGLKEKEGGYNAY